MEPASYKLEVGASSADIRQTTEVTLSGEWNAALKNVYAVAEKYCYNVGDEGYVSVSATLEDTTHLCMQKYAPVFTSSDEAVATVDADGKVTAKASGVCEITAAVTCNGVKKTAVVPVAVR